MNIGMRLWNMNIAMFMMSITSTHMMNRLTDLILIGMFMSQWDISMPTIPTYTTGTDTDAVLKVTPRHFSVK